MALSAIVTVMAAASGRTCQFALAAQRACDRAPAPHLIRRSGRRPPHPNFRFAVDTGDRRSSPRRFSVPSGRTAESVLLAVPATFYRGCSHADGCVCIGEVGQSCPQPGRSRGAAVSPKSCRFLAGQRPTPESLSLLRLGGLCDLEALSPISRIRGRPRRPLWRRSPERRPPPPV